MNYCNEQYLNSYFFPLTPPTSFGFPLVFLPIVLCGLIINPCNVGFKTCQLPLIHLNFAALWVEGIVLHWSLLRSCALLKYTLGKCWKRFSCSFFESLSAVPYSTRYDMLHVSLQWFAIVQRSIEECLFCFVFPPWCPCHFLWAR